RGARRAHARDRPAVRTATRAHRTQPPRPEPCVAAGGGWGPSPVPGGVDVSGCHRPAAKPEMKLPSAARPDLRPCRHLCTWCGGERGTALMEFALAWPIVLLLVLGAVEMAVWGSESASAREAALAGARAGTVAGAGGQAAGR